MAAQGYIYVSQENAEQVPLEEQKSSILEYCREQGFQVTEMFIEEGVSLRQPLDSRPEGRKMVACAQKGDTLVVTRSTFVLGSSREACRLLAELRQRGVSLICLDLDEDISCDRERRLIVSAGGAVVIQKLLAALSVCDGSRHGESIRAAKRNSKKAGKYLGGPVPFGRRVGEDGHLVQDPERQRIIQEMRQLRQDRWSYRNIAAKLMENHGLRLSHEGVRRILETNAGE
jgi:DNA invertase Pin-like site-specific DNA recombinase